MEWEKALGDAQRTKSVNVVCMKWGRLYGPEWVNKLCGMVARNTTWKVRFVCLTDDSERPTSINPTFVPAYKKGSDLASRFCSEDTCHLPPRADLMPRAFSALATSARVAAPAA
jgi:hypothetical protein